MRSQIVPYQLVQGIDVGGEPLTSAGLLKAENCEFRRRGAISKRPGLLTVSTGRTETAAGTFDGQLILLGDQLAVWNSASNDWDVVESAPLFDLQDIEDLCTINTRPLSCDVAEVGDIRVVAYSYLADATLNVAQNDVVIIRKTTGVVISRQDLGIHISLADQRGLLRAITGNGVVHVFYLSIAGGSDVIHHWTVSSAGTWTAQADIALSVARSTSHGGLDVDYLADAAHTFMLVYPDTAGDVQVVMAGDGGATSATRAATLATRAACCCLRTGVGALVYYDDTTNFITALAYDTSLSVAVSAAVLGDAWLGNFRIENLACAATGTTRVQVVWDEEEASAASGSHQYAARSDALLESPAGTGVQERQRQIARGVTIRSKPFISSTGATYVVVSPHLDLGLAQPAYVVMRVPWGGVLKSSPVAKFLQGYQYPSVGCSPAPVTYGDTDTWQLTALTWGKWFHGGASDRIWGPSKPSDPDMGIGVEVLGLRKGLSGANVLDTGRSLMIPGALPQEYDGASVVEQGFLQYPYKIALSLMSPVTPYLGVGLYGYMAVYEAFDDAGRRHVSAPSPVVSITTTSGHEGVTVDIPPLTVSLRQRYRVVIYRTLMNGSTFYRVASVEATVGSTSTPVTFGDLTPDADIEGEEQIYTAGDQLPNIDPPPYRVSCIHQNRMFLVPIESEQREVWYSRPILDSMGIQFSDVLVQKMDAGETAILGLVSHYARLLAFSANRTLVFDGDGLNSAGFGSGYAVYQLAQGVGCRDQRTIVQCPAGVLFQSSTCIKLIDRAMQISDVGDPVRYHTDTLTLRRGLLLEHRDAVVFLTSGSALLWNYRLNAWSTLTNHAAIDGAVINSQLHFLVSGGAVKREQPNVYTDDGSAFARTIETGWISFAGLAGFCRFKRALLVGYNIAPHTLSVAFQIDGDPVWLDTQTFASSSLAGYFDFSSYLGAGLASSYADKAYLLEAVTSVQRLTSIRMRISDGTAANAAADIVGVAFLVAPKPGPAQPGPSRQTTGS